MTLLWLALALVAGIAIGAFFAWLVISIRDLSGASA